MRNDDDYQHQGGRGPGLGGKANICEPLINVVRSNKPKVLNKVGLDQKGKWKRAREPVSLAADGTPPANRRSQTHLGFDHGTW